MTAYLLTLTGPPAAGPALVLLLVLLTAHHRPRHTATSDRATTEGRGEGK